MSFSFHPDAEKEFNQAIDYYESLQHGLGYDLLTLVKNRSYMPQLFCSK